MHTADFSILDIDVFNKIDNTNEFSELKEKYLPKIDPLDFIYFYIALIGFYIAIVINFTKNSDKIGKRLISIFIIVHAFFILDFVFYSTNYQFKYANTYLMSASVALLYGPLLFFYFKRLTEQYKFRWIDLFHFLPTLILLLFLLPVYSLPFEEKIKVQLGTSEVYSPNDFLFIIFIPKLLSLIIYGFFISKLYLKKQEGQHFKNNSAIVFWKKGIYKMHMFYVFSYLAYGISISGVFFSPNPFLYQSQIIAMSLMVLYVAYMAQVQPAVFSKEVLLSDDSFFSKYQKSGLTKSLSEELKQNLISLLVTQKIYKDNSINLEKLSNVLDTSRHNTSQIINEQFNMNFFELINKFRVDEAISLLKENKLNSLQIIDIAYEVGYNNKVTFNKAFKKETSLTPSQFLKSIENNR
jgi:AraC-like DNA-binding protein